MYTVHGIRNTVYGTYTVVLRRIIVICLRCIGSVVGHGHPGI